MKRSGLILGAVVILLGMLFGGIAWIGSSAAAGEPRAQSQESGIEYVTNYDKKYVAATEAVIGAVIRGGSGDRIVCYPGVSDCPDLQKTLQGPSETPLFVTSTPVPPSPSFTALPTNTPRPSATPMPTITPTQEQIQLTPTPTSAPKTCELKVNRNLNKRSGAGTAFAIIGSIAQGMVVQVREFAADKSYVWAKIETNGWIAVRDLVTPEWWADGTDSGEFCVDVAGWPENLVPPLPITRRGPALGFHAVPGANADEMMSAFAVLKAAGIPFGVKVVNEPDLCRKTVAAGGICIYRSVYPADCPNVNNTDPVQEAYLYMLSLSPYVNQQTNATYVEIVNECDFGPDRLAWWNQFLLEAVRLAQEWRWPPLIAPTWAPGQPTDEWHLDLIRPALVALRDSGGALGIHNYSIYKDVGLCQSDQWLGYRHRRIHAKLVEMGLGDLKLAITEAARGGGNEAVSVADFACWYKSIEGDPYVLMVGLWTAGRTNTWPLADLNSWMLPIARAVRQ